MHVLLISRYFHHSTSGIQTYIEAIDKGYFNDSLSIIAKNSNKPHKIPIKNHKVYYCYKKKLRNIQCNFLIKLFVKGFIKLFFLLVINRTVRYQISERLLNALQSIKKQDINICISAIVSPEGLIPVILKKLYGFKSVILLHGSEIHSFSGRFQHKWLMKYILENSDIVVANSFFMKSEVQKFVGSKMNNVFVNYMGYDDKIFNIKNNYHEKKKYYKSVILTVSNFVYGKGLDILLNALAEVKKTRQDFIYIMLGNRRDGSYQDYLDELIVKKELKDFVQFQDGVHHDKLPSFYHSCDFVVLPSRKEAFGLVILEANACGKPVIGSDVGGIPEIIKDRENGLLFKPESHMELAEKIIYLLENPDYCRDLGYNARKKVETTFTWERSIKRLKQRINKI
ncbi:MAG: glycosyltransferase family 4 protein [Candidatus Cloacimonetes bacterium]|nr:glycosyltransferase family 4 protein [Candidatus Cloacimonadota bacterium]